MYNVYIFLLDRIVVLKESSRHLSMLTPEGYGNKRASIVSTGSWLESIALRPCPYFRIWLVILYVHIFSGGFTVLIYLIFTKKM